MQYTLVKDYKDNRKYRKSFNALSRLTFSIDFEKWHELGFWNDRYICYSFADGDKIISNASANLYDIILQGIRIPTLQIGTVMTHPDYRRSGLAEKLIREILHFYQKECELCMLFGEKSARSFYGRFDFDTVVETRFTAAITPSRKTDSSFRKFNMDDSEDLAIFKRLSANRIPVSNVFDTAKTQGILAWHCINSFPDNLYYCEIKDALVIYAVQDKELQLYDIVSTKKIPLLEIITEIAVNGINKVVFHFTPDTNELDLAREPNITDEYDFYLKSETSRLDTDFFFPFTAHA